MPEKSQQSRKTYPGWFIQRMADRLGDRRQVPSEQKGSPPVRRHSPPTPGDGAGRQSAPPAPNSHYRLRRGILRGESKHAKGGIHQLSSTNIYGLASRSEQFYPEAFKPVEDRYWNDLSEIERDDLARRRVNVMKKLTYREFEGLPKQLTAAEEAYEDAQVRRHDAMRRRKRKPRNYEERKKWEEEQRKAPLVRKYVFREHSHLEPSQFYKPGALENPVLIESKIIGQSKSKQKTEAPKTLKVRRMKRLAAKQRQETLPTTETKGKPRVEISRYHNPYGLQSRSVTAYPEAYQSVSSVFYQQMSQEDRDRITKVQAQAMEKVGFEPRTQKHFIEDFDPMEQNILAPGTWEAPAESKAAEGDYNPYDEQLSLQNRFSDHEFEPAKTERKAWKMPKTVRIVLGGAIGLAGMGMAFSATTPGASPLLIVAGIACLITGLVMIVGRFD